MSDQIIELLIKQGVIWYAKTAPERFVLAKDEYKVGDLVYAQLEDVDDPSAGVYIAPFFIELVGGEK